MAGSGESDPLPALRAGDADREAAADALSAHCAAGRLSVAELEERLGKALSARTLGDLDRLVSDLPGGRVPARTWPAAAPAKIKVGWPGLQPFYQRHTLRTPRKVAFEQATLNIVPSMVRVGFEVIGRNEPEMLVFERRERPGWVPLACIFLFPFGLLALTVHRSHRVVVTFDEVDPNSTRLAVQGTASRGVRKAFAELGA